MHGHAHSHDHGHGHSHDHRATAKKHLFIAAIVLTLYMVAEVVGGLIANSLALLADAGHMLTDVAALGLSLFAIWIAQRPATPQRTYGYYRLEVLAALVNGAALLAIAIFVVKEAVGRLGQPAEVRGELLLGVAAGGLVVNLFTLWLLHGDREESLNVRGAWLHVVMDTLGSVGAVAAGALILGPGWMWADPAISILIALLVSYSAWALLREVVAVLMEGTPAHIDLEEVRSTLSETDGVLNIHDLHVWTISSGIVALSGHVVVREDHPCGSLLHALTAKLRERFGIEHATLQIEPEGFESEERQLPI